jgi:hypothetical protein
MIRAMAVVLCLATLPVLAQYKDCRTAQLPATYHLLVDDFRFSDENSVPADMKLVREVLYGSVENQLEAMKLQNLPSLRTSRCTGRWPQASDFTKPRVESLNNRDVVMELWTEIRPSEENRFDAEFNVLLVPAMLLSLSGQNTPPLFRSAYPLTKNQRKEQLLALLRNHPELNAYALIGAGLRAVENRDYDVANAFLCRGMAELRQAPKTQDHDKLLKYVDAASAKVVADARRDTVYIGPLRLLAPNAKGCVK